jgi:hypothetical protein
MLLGARSLGNERDYIKSAANFQCTISESSLDLPYGDKHLPTFAKHVR